MDNLEEVIQELNIVQLIRHPGILNDPTLSAAQETILLSIYGQPLTPNQLEIYQRGTGRASYDPEEQNEVTVLAGRRSGKSLKIAVYIVIFEAIRHRDFPKGERGFCILLAPTLRQARILLRVIAKKLKDSPLSKLVARVTAYEIDLKNGITIGCYPPTHDGIRGHTVVVAVCDEFAFWKDEETAANPAEEVLAALRPGMATVCHPKLVKITTPFRKEGLVWDEYRRRDELDFPVWQLPSSEMNPTLTPDVLSRERQRNEQEFRREFLAEFTNKETSWIDPESLEACIAGGYSQLPATEGLLVAALDPAARGDDFVLAILQRRPDCSIAMLLLQKWTGTKNVPLDFRAVLREVATILQRYGLNRAVGDQFCFDVIKQILLEFGVVYEIRNFGIQTRGNIFGNLKHLILQRQIQLVDHSDLLTQLRCLREETTSRGNIDVRPSGDQHDDLAVATALAATELVNMPSRPSPFMIGASRNGKFGRTERNLRGVEHNILPVMTPGSCPYEAVCDNYPICMEHDCQGFDHAAD